MVTPLLPKKRGQPKIENWEKWSVIKWANEVHRQVIDKMAQMPLPDSDPFANHGKLIQARWRTPQRKTQSPGIVTLNDLDMIFVGTQKSSFYKYTKGQNSRLRKSLIEDVDKALPGTKAIYQAEKNYEGIPVWAAVAGKITVDDFWKPLVMSGQVTDALELHTGGFDWMEANVRAPQPNLVSDGKRFVTDASFQSSMRYDASVIVPKLPWVNMVLALSAQLAPSRDPDEAISAGMIKADSVTLGEATLAIALAQLALRDLEASKIAKENLRQILIGLIPFWTHFDSTTPTPQSTVALTVSSLASRL